MLNVRVEGQLVFNGSYQMLNAGWRGPDGLAYVPENLQLQPHLAKGRLQVLEDWCPPFSG